MLMTISLMITILNKTWIHKAFRSLRRRHRVYLGEDRGNMSERADAAVVIAEVAQQAPTRLKQTEQSLARQVFLNEHKRWGEQARYYL